MKGGPTGCVNPRLSNSKRLKTARERLLKKEVTNTQQKDKVVEMIKNKFPNVAKNINRDNAPVEMKQIVAAWSHEVVQENTKEGHVARQKIRDEIFEKIHHIANNKKQFGI